MVVRHAALCAVLLGTVIATKTESDGVQEAMDSLETSSVLRSPKSTAAAKWAESHTILEEDEEVDDMNMTGKEIENLKSVLAVQAKKQAERLKQQKQPSDKHSSQRSSQRSSQLSSQLSQRPEVRMTASQANLFKQQNQAREALSLLRALGLNGIAEELEWVRRIIRRIKKKAVK